MSGKRYSDEFKAKAVYISQSAALLRTISKQHGRQVCIAVH